MDLKVEASNGSSANPLVLPADWIQQALTLTLLLSFSGNDEVFGRSEVRLRSPSGREFRFVMKAERVSCSPVVRRWAPPAGAAA